MLIVNSKHRRLKFVRHSVHCPSFCIQTKTVQRMQMFSSVIWYQFMKCWKIQQNEKSKWNNTVVVCLGRTFFIVKKLLFCTSRYNKVLKDGLPDWKSALYYYRRYRKMGLAEMIGLVFVIFTIAQYIVSWAVYAEKKYTAVSSYGVTTCQKLHVLSTPHH